MRSLGSTGAAPRGVARTLPWGTLLRAVVAVAAAGWLVVAVLLVRHAITLDVSGTLHDPESGRMAMGPAFGLLIGALVLGWAPLALVVWVATTAWRLAQAVRGRARPRRPSFARTLVGVLAAWALIGGFAMSASVSLNHQAAFFDPSRGGWQAEAVMARLFVITLLGFVPTAIVAALIHLGGVLDRKLGTA